MEEKGKKIGVLERLRRVAGRSLCRLFGIETAAQFKKRRISGATATEWREAAEKLVVLSMPSLLDEFGGKDVDFSPSLAGTGVYGYKYQAVMRALPGVTFVENSETKPDYCFFWGFGRSWSNVVSALTCARTGCLPVLCEDSFLRSADTWANTNTPPQYRALSSSRAANTPTARKPTTAKGATCPA